MSLYLYICVIYTTSKCLCIVSVSAQRTCSSQRASRCLCPRRSSAASTTASRLLTAARTGWSHRSATTRSSTIASLHSCVLLLCTSSTFSFHLPPLLHFFILLSCNFVLFITFNCFHSFGSSYLPYFISIVM